MKADTGGPGRAPRAAAAPPRGAATRTGRLRLSATSGALPQRPGCPAGTAPCPRRSSVPVSPVKLSQPSAAPARISRARGSTASARRNKVAAPRRGRIPSRRARAAAGSPVGGCQRLIPPPLPVNARSLPGHRRCPPKEAPGAAAPLPPLRAHTDTQIRCVRLRESAPPPSGCSDLKPTGNLSVLVAAPAGGSGEEERFLLLLFLLFFSPPSPYIQWIGTWSLCTSAVSEYLHAEPLCCGTSARSVEPSGDGTMFLALLYLALPLAGKLCGCSAPRGAGRGACGAGCPVAVSPPFGQESEVSTTLHGSASRIARPLQALRDDRLSDVGLRQVAGKLFILMEKGW